MAGKISYRSLYELVVTEIEKRSKFDTTSPYKDQGSRVSISPVVGDGRSDAYTAELVTAIQNLLEEALPATIIEGLEVIATDPISSSITINAGKGSVGGVLYTLEETITLSIPFDSSTSVFYIVLYKDAIKIERTYSVNKLTIAKVVVPNPGVTSLIQDTKDGSWNAYIVNFQEYKLYGMNDKFEEDTIELLRDNISPILADNIIGNIRLNENLKILNTAGTLELDSNSMKLYDTNENLMAKFNKDGTFFYDTSGRTLAKFGRDEAYVGNIRIIKNAIQSRNFVSGSIGFKIKDDGSVEFSDGTFRGTLSAPLGLIGGWTIDSDSLYATTTGTIKTSLNVEAGYNGVVLDKDGIRVYDDVLGMVVNLPSDGSAPSFSSGIIEETIFEIQTNAILRTSETVGDDSVDSYGILINNTGIYGCGVNQSLGGANLKALVTGNIYLTGEINATSGQIANITITKDKLYGGVIESSILRAGVYETTQSTPKIRIDDKGIYYQTTTNIGKYGESGSGLYGFKYGDGTYYGSGVTAYLFKSDIPVLSIETELEEGDIHLYNRLADPTSGTHRIGDLICVSGVLKICSVGGSPGTFINV
jgi:hypothetical protein